MEREKKRKRAAEKATVACSGGVKRREKEAEVKAEETTTEEEVEEFYAILRRMRVAVNYFEKANGDGRRKGRKLTGISTTALEADVFLGIDGAKAAAEEERGKGGVRGNGVFDLNAVPQVESNSV